MTQSELQNSSVRFNAVATVYRALKLSRFGCKERENRYDISRRMKSRNNIRKKFTVNVKSKGPEVKVVVCWYFYV